VQGHSVMMANIGSMLRGDAKSRVGSSSSLTKTMPLLYCFS
jgi:hypothetical protein